MKKKFLVGLLAVVMCFTLVGCGKTENDGSKDNGGSTTNGGTKTENISWDSVTKENALESLPKLMKVDFNYPNGWEPTNILIFKHSDDIEVEIEFGERSKAEVDALAKELHEKTVAASKSEGYKVARDTLESAYYQGHYIWTYYLKDLKINVSLSDGTEGFSNIIILDVTVAKN